MNGPENAAARGLTVITLVWVLARVASGIAPYDRLAR